MVKYIILKDNCNFVSINLNYVLVLPYELRLHYKLPQCVHNVIHFSYNNLLYYVENCYIKKLLLHYELKILLSFEKIITLWTFYYNNNVTLHYVQFLHYVQLLHMSCYTGFHKYFIYLRMWKSDVWQALIHHVAFPLPLFLVYLLSKCRTQW